MGSWRQARPAEGGGGTYIHPRGLGSEECIYPFLRPAVSPLRYVASRPVTNPAHYKSDLEWENIGFGGKSRVPRVIFDFFNLAGEYAVEIRSKFDHLGCFETCRNFRYNV